MPIKKQNNITGYIGNIDDKTEHYKNKRNPNRLINYESIPTNDIETNNFKQFLIDSGHKVTEVIIKSINENQEQVTIMYDTQEEFLIITPVTKKYFDNNIATYKDLFKRGFMTLDEFKYERFRIHPVETYIEHHYNSVAGARTYYNYSALVKAGIIQKNDFKTLTIHEPIEVININFQDAKIKGTYIDYCIRKIIDETTLGPLKYLKSCAFYNDLSDDIKNIDNDYDLISQTFSINFKDIIKKKLCKYFPNLQCGKFSYNHDIQLYGTPDIITPDYIIDIKTSIRSVTTSHNYIQLLLYALILKKRKMGLYDPLRGEIYVIELSEKYYKSFFDHIINENKKLENKKSVQTRTIKKEPYCSTCKQKGHWKNQCRASYNYEDMSNDYSE
jgi:hypothetical protein